MQEFTPSPPLCTLNELRFQDPLGYEIVMLLVRHTASGMYQSFEAMRNLGLEKCEEAIMDLIDTGYARICETKISDDEEDDTLWVGFFNSATGEYAPAGSRVMGGDFELG